MTFIRCIGLEFSKFGLLHCVRYNGDLFYWGILSRCCSILYAVTLAGLKNIERCTTLLYKGIRCNDVYSQPRRREFIESSSSNKDRDTASLEKST